VAAAAITWVMFGRQHHDLGPAGRHLAAPDLGALLPGIGERRADGVLDRLGRAFTDGHAVLVPDVGLYGGVEVEAATAQGPDGHHSAE
jgi:hypothetical protein